LSYLPKSRQIDFIKVLAIVSIQIFPVHFCYFCLIKQKLLQSHPMKMLQIVRINAHDIIPIDL
jgi:hypothetical protein